MKNLTNLYVYDGNKLPKLITSDISDELQSVENVPANVLLYGKTPGVQTRLQITNNDGEGNIVYGDIIYIYTTRDNTKPLSYKEGENEFKFFIKAYAYDDYGGNLNGEVVVKSFQMAGFGDAPIPFGQSFHKETNESNKIVIKSDEMGLQLGALYECIYSYITYIEGNETKAQPVIVARRIGGYEKLSTTFYKTSTDEGKGFYVPYIGDGMYVLNVKKQPKSGNVTYEQFSTFITKNVFPGSGSYQISMGDFAIAIIESPYSGSEAIPLNETILVLPTTGYTIWCTSATYIPL